MPPARFHPALRRPAGAGFLWLLDVAVVAAALLTIPLTVAQVRSPDDRLLHEADWVVWVVFLIEYVVRFRLAPDRARFVRRQWLLLAVVVLTFPGFPHVLALAGATRVFVAARVLRLIVVASRAAAILGSSTRRAGLLYMVGMTALVVFVGSGLMLVLESDEVIPDYGSALWWALVTVTTVGYGDIAPKSFGGRVLAVIVMMMGIGLVSTLAAAVAATFIGADERSEFEAIAARLDRIEALLGADAAPANGLPAPEDQAATPDEDARPLRA
jgi:voltage-gated potassium channel